MVHRGIKALGIREKLHDLLMKIMLLLFFSFCNDFYHYRLVRTTKYCFLFIFMVHQISFQLHIWFPKRMRVLHFQVPSEYIHFYHFLFTVRTSDVLLSRHHLSGSGLWERRHCNQACQSRSRFVQKRMCKTQLQWY